jgi:tRNA(Ile)-lysidine synthase
MLNQFQIQLQKLVNQPKTKTFLVASSGGLDSTVLIYLCHKLNLNFGICHVNFQLRGEESDQDQRFLENLAQTYKQPIYTLEENAKTYAKQHQLSTQEAARMIRYAWFEECLKTKQYDYVLTAHHADDNLETYLINSFRGTGIKGLTGIPKKRDYILRPLLHFTREDILDFAKSKELTWREDQSNTSDKYLRNVIRHHLLPFFQKRQDNLYARFETTQNHINRQETLLEDYLKLIFNQVVETKVHSYQFKIDILKQFPNHNEILIELCKDFNFTDWDSITELLDAQVGKYVTSSSHKLVKERGFLELFLLEDYSFENKHINLKDLPQTVEFKEGTLHFESAKTFKKTDATIAYLSKDLLKSDLKLRPVEIGDYFYPLGMHGKRKLSDFLKDEKISTFEKSKVRVLTHQNDIVWVVNHRIDNRYKITENTQECLKVQFIP